MTTRRGASLTSQLLAFSRRAPSVRTKVDLSAAIRDLEPMLGRLLTASVTVHTELGVELPPVWVDQGQLTQVVKNLLVNARDAMPEGGTVVIRTSRVAAEVGDRAADAPEGEWVCREVQDTGVGMTPEIQARIFEPYFTTKAVERGTGLGLAMVYGAVQTAGGTITVRSTLGVGTTFRVYLPQRRSPRSSGPGEAARR